MNNKKGNAPHKKEEANYFDKIIKENCSNLVPFIFRKIFGLEFDKIDNLPEIKQQTTKEKEPDFLRIVYNDEYSEGVIVQLEFETSDYQKMDKRMLEYIAILHKRTEKPVLQYVLYLGIGKANMNRIIKFGGLNFSFDVLNIQDFSYQDFINSPYPEEVILSLLASPDDISEDEMLDMIIHRIIQLEGDTLSRKRFTNQLILLSRIRNLQYKVVKKINDMHTTLFDVKSDFLYKEGREEGREEGHEEGVEEGVEKGKLKKSIVAIQNMLVKKFDKKLIADILVLEIAFVEKIQKQLFKKDKIIASLKIDNSNLEAIAKKLKVHLFLVEVMQEELDKKQKK